MKMKSLMTVASIALASLFAQGAMAAVDAAAAQALAKKEGCLKCHAVDKEKEAKSFQDIAKELKSKSVSDAKIIEHLTTGPKVKMKDGSEEEHKVIKTKDKAEIDNLIAWLRAPTK